MKQVFERLQTAGLRVDIDKCKIDVTETRFHGLIVGKDGIRMDPEKVRAIVGWETPRNLKQVRAFVGKTVKALMALTRKRCDI